jgi:putative transferase (TIGR04331 family)
MTKEKKFLITTALEETWDINQPVLFLGEWCKWEQRRSVWNTMDIQTLDWDWDDKELLLKDMQTINVFYEEILEKLTQILNDQHKVKYTKRYWRILLNPWLGRIVFTLFDRWRCISKAYNKYQIIDTYCLEIDAADMIPQHSIAFKQGIIFSDVWNHYVYSKIIKFLQYNHSTINTSHKYSVRDCNKYKLSLKSLTKHCIYSMFLSINSFRHRKDTPLFIGTMLSNELELQIQKLFIKNGASIRRSTSLDHLLYCKLPNMELRNKLKYNIKYVSGFKKFAADFIIDQIPISYLEGFSDLEAKCNSLKLPDNPKFVVTAVNHLGSETIKMYIAKNTEKGTKLFLLQHGASYGTAKYTFYEEHEKIISDKFFSWGWTDDTNKVVPFCNIKTQNKNTITQNKKGNLLLVTVICQSYFTDTSSSILGGAQWIKYTKNSQYFYNKLNDNIRDNFVLRLSPSGMANNWNYQYGRWTSFNSKISFSEDKNIDDAYTKARIAVVDYDGTPFLECMSMDYPVILIQNPDLEPIRESAQPYYKKLKDLNILHENTLTAVAHINDIWGDIDAWWYDDETIKAKKIFVDQYARHLKDPANIFFAGVCK